MRTAARVGDVTVASYAYTLGPTGIRTRIDEADGTTRSYEYDELYRLTKETVSGEQSYEKTFAYDQVSNRLSQTRSADAADAGAPNGNGGTINYTYDNRDRLIGEDSTVYSWSANGNLVGRTGDGTFEWDFEDRLVKVVKADGTVVENVYDVDGVLVRTAVNGVGTDYLVDTSGGLSHVVAEVDSSGAVAVLYVRAGDMLLEEIRGGVAKMYEADGLGSVRGLLDASGAKTDAYSYEAFGETLSQSGTDGNPYQFAGERLVDSVGFYQNRARWLDTRTGRFVSVDPNCSGQGCGREPIRMHSYLYGNASPVSYLDPTGREYTLADVGVTMAAISVAAIGAYAGVATAWNFAKTLDQEAIGPASQMRAFEEIRVVYGPDPDHPIPFDEGVDHLVHYWWATVDPAGHDVYSTGVAARVFRNSNGLSIEQDRRIQTAEYYLLGLNHWNNSDGPWMTTAAGYEIVKDISPYLIPPWKGGNYPPGPFTPNSFDWYRQGREGFGTVTVPVGCWRWGDSNLQQLRTGAGQITRDIPSYCH